MSYDPTRRDVNHDVEKSMDMFQRARVGEVAAIEPQHPRHALVVLDGSAQDATTITIARQLQQKRNVQLTVIDARDSGSEDLAERVAQQLQSTAAPRRTGEPFEQILAEAGQSGADLVLVPCPYGRELASVGPDSAGTVIDVLLARSPVHLLVVRTPIDRPESQLREVLLLLSIAPDRAVEAAGWAAGMATDVGTLRLLLLLEENFPEHSRELLKQLGGRDEVSVESLEEAMARSYGRLHRALQKTADKSGYSYELIIEREGEDIIRWNDESRNSLLVLPLDRTEPHGQSDVQDYIRHSPHPVLVVVSD